MVKNSPFETLTQSRQTYRENEAPTSKLVGIKRNSSEAEYPPTLKLRKGYSPLTPSSDQQVGRYSAKENKKTPAGVTEKDSENRILEAIEIGLQDAISATRV